MFHHHADGDYTFKTTFHWFMLAFIAGAINAGGYLACARFVSHVTGFATLAGVSLAVGRVDSAIGILSVPLFFLGGVMASAYLVDRQHHEGKRPHYATVMFLVSLCLVLAAVGGHLGFFNPFGGDPKLKRDYFLLALLCLASGLQNATITTASGATVRTTHLTGITTDLGIGIIRSTARGTPSAVKRRERKSNLLRAGTIASFGVGSAVSAYIYLQVGFLGFLLPAALALYAAFVAIYESTLH